MSGEVGGLGGYNEYNQRDLEFQENFFITNSAVLENAKTCLEIASGCGRITKKILSYHFDLIDFNDVSKK